MCSRILHTRTTLALDGLLLPGLVKNKTLCRRAALTWVYPKEVPERQYQVEIIQTALLHNTLVCLPTGLGKTLIAAVVMHNFARWFPEVCSALLYVLCKIGGTCTDHWIAMTSLTSYPLSCGQRYRSSH